MTQPIDFPDEWFGWRLRGRHLVSPDGERITRERLSGLLWRDQQELRRAGFASRRKAEANRARAAAGVQVRVVIIEIAELRQNGRLAS